MLSATSPRSFDKPALSTALFGALMVLATLAGGASFADTLGQAVVRVGVMLLAAAAIGLGLRFDWRSYRGPAFLIGAAIVLVALQLIPLPNGLWRALPGRAAFDLSGVLPAAAGGWRPAAIVPDAAWNALFSLTVPACALLLLTAVPRAQLSMAVPLLIAMIGLSSVVAALQFVGGAFDNPMINERIGFASGLLSNRNHQALFLAIGVVAAMQWAVVRPFVQLRAIIAGVSAAWFVLMILATGSRGGLLLGIVALLAGAVIVLSALRRDRVRISRRTGVIAGAAAVLVLTGIVSASVFAGRSESLSRLNEASVGEDMRLRALPIVFDLAKVYAPIGAGQGSFTTLFTVVEPDALLKPTYFNRAHDDYLELAIEAGVPGLMLLAGALFWFVRRAWLVWRLPPNGEIQRARLGSIVILLVLMASAVDYPSRTPLIMTVLVLASGWLSIDRAASAGLPRDNPTV